MCLGPDGIGRQERQIDFGFEHIRQLDFGLLSGLFQALQGHLILGDVNAGFLLELLHQPVDNPLVDVVATQVRVAVGGFDFHHPISDFEDGNVERAATEVIHRDGFVLLFVEPVRQSSGGGFVDDAHHLQARDLPCVLGGLALRIVEIGRNCDHGLGDLLAEIGFRGFLQLGQNHRGNLRRGVAFAVDLDAGVPVLAGDHFVWNQLHLLAHFVEAAAHEALDRIDGVFRVGDRLTLSHLPYQPFTALGESDDGRRCPAALLVRNDDSLAAFHDGYDGVGRSQVYTYDFAHSSSILRLRIRLVLACYHYQTLVCCCQVVRRSAHAALNIHLAADSCIIR